MRLFFDPLQKGMTEEEWTNSRRSFVKSLVLTGIALQLPWIQSCSDKEHETISIPTNIHPLNRTDFLNLHCALSVLFPEDGNGPGAKTIKADQYILWVLNDTQMDAYDINFITDNLTRFTKCARTEYNTDFHHLDTETQAEFIADLAEIKWSKKLFSRLLTLTFEALLLDPQYGGNTEKAGWQWLEHNPGYPRPSKQLVYPTILNKKMESHEV